MIAGDFNAVLDQIDKKGGQPVSSASTRGEGGVSRFD